MTIFQNFIGHLRTVSKHRCVVRKLCFKCGLYWQGLTHDLSKYSPVEFVNGVKFYTGVKSPHCGERAKYGYSTAWLHHKGHNKHHAEYWQDIYSDGFTRPVIMPKRYLGEMICDRIAASMVYLGNKYTDSAPFEYYLSHKNESQFHEDTRNQLEYWLNRVAEIGTMPALAEFKNNILI